MKIIYDEAKAIQEKEKNDISIPKKDRRRTINNTIFVIVVLAVLVGVFFGARFLIENAYETFPSEMSFWIAIFAALGVCFFFVVFLSEVCLFGWEPPLDPCEWYSANVRYYLAAKDKTVLGHKLHLQGEKYILELTLEDKNHIVSKTRIWQRPLKVKIRTDVSETIVDLEKDVVYMPYQADPS